MRYCKLVRATCLVGAVLAGLGVGSVSGAAEAALGDGAPTSDGRPMLMLRPQRPSQFRHEGDVKAYLQRLRDRVEDSMRNNARFGKRGYDTSSGSLDAIYHKSPTPWTTYNYFARYNA